MYFFRNGEYLEVRSDREETSGTEVSTTKNPRHIALGCIVVVISLRTKTNVLRTEVRDVRP